ncbi:hypothetical protein DFQ29_003013, partial [Apophysomyces sp. BC1021]
VVQHTISSCLLPVMNPVASESKRPLPEDHADETEERKKLRTDPETDQLKSLPKSLRKKCHKALRIGQAFKIVGGNVVLQPKLILKPHGSSISIKEVRTLIMGCIIDEKLPKWAEIRERELVKKVIVLDAPILHPADLDMALDQHYVCQQSSSSEVYSKLKGHGICEFLGQRASDEVLAMVTSVQYDDRQGLDDRFTSLLQSPLSKGELKKKRHPTESEDGSNLLQPEELMLKHKEMVEEEYPIPASVDIRSELLEGWRDTPAGEGKEKRMMALDCEMCKTLSGFVITRVALVDQADPPFQDHKVLIDEFVKPDEEIVDYVTEFSGVTADSLKGVNTTLADIQNKLLSHINGDTILVGHSMSNDLNKLQIRHPCVIDTSCIYHHVNGPPYKASLRDLTYRWLRREIQTGEEKGHDPCEDALASLELVERKLKFGKNYGWHQSFQSETILHRLESSSLLGAVIDGAPNYDLIMANKLAEKDGFQVVFTDDLVVNNVIEKHHLCGLVLAKFALKVVDKEKAFLQHVRQIYDSMEPNTALFVMTGQRNDEELQRLRAKCQMYKKKMKVTCLEEISEEERWTLADEERLRYVTDATRRGLLFAAIKNEA